MNEEIILWTKNDCTKCEFIKAHCDLSEVRTMELNQEDPKALSLLAYYELVTIAEKEGLPILVVNGHPDEFHWGSFQVITDPNEIAKKLGANGHRLEEECFGAACAL